MSADAFSHLAQCGGIVEDDYGEESNAWDDGEPSGGDDHRAWAGDMRGACGHEFMNRTEYNKHLQQHSGRAAAPQGPRAGGAFRGIGRPRRRNTGRLCANVGQLASPVESIGASWAGRRRGVAE